MCERMEGGGKGQSDGAHRLDRREGSRHDLLFVLLAELLVVDPDALAGGQAEHHLKQITELRDGWEDQLTVQIMYRGGPDYGLSDSEPELDCLVVLPRPRQRRLLRPRLSRGLRRAPRWSRLYTAQDRQAPTMPPTTEQSVATNARVWPAPTPAICCTGAREVGGWSEDRERVSNLL